MYKKYTLKKVDTGTNRRYFRRFLRRFGIGTVFQNIAIGIVFLAERCNCIVSRVYCDKTTGARIM